MGIVRDLLMNCVPGLLRCLIHKDNQRDTLILIINPSSFMPLVTFLKKHSLVRITQLVDLCISDRLNVIDRFELNYLFLSTVSRYRFCIRFFISEYDVVVSLSSLFKNALWVEREAWDTFGVFFYNNPDLRRILTDYGFDGFPFRKDFPLTGFFELRYDDTKSHIVYELVELTQNFRYFNSLSPWEQMIM